MGLLSRAGEIIKAKFNALLNRAENPNETLDYSYEKQLQSLQNVKRGVADVVTAKKRLQIQTKQLEQNVVTLDTQARQASAAGREDLARQALERKSGIQQQLQDLDTQVKQLEDQQEKLVSSEKQLVGEDRAVPLAEGSDQGPVLGRRGAGPDRRGCDRHRARDGEHRPRDPAGEGQDRADAGARVRDRRARLVGRPRGARLDHDAARPRAPQVASQQQVDRELEKIKAEVGSGSSAEGA